jgi:hypothetical protein
MCKNYIQIYIYKYMCMYDIKVYCISVCTTHVYMIVYVQSICNKISNCLPVRIYIYCQTTSKLKYVGNFAVLRRNKTGSVECLQQPICFIYAAATFPLNETLGEFLPTCWVSTRSERSPNWSFKCHAAQPHAHSSLSWSTVGTGQGSLQKWNIGKANTETEQQKMYANVLIFTDPQ